MIIFVTLILCCTLLPGANSESNVYHQSRVSTRKQCEPITIPMCMDIAYNMTTFPNIINHQTQDEARAAINQFQPLIKVRCSDDIKLFLCTVYAPVCTMLDQPIQPCRGLCESAKNGCENLMIKFGYRWPEHLECDRFPADGSELCVGENRTSSTHHDEHHGWKSGGMECPQSMKASAGAHFRLPLATGVLEDCSLLCSADNQYPMLLDARVRRYIRFWTGGWAVACCVCALFTVFTFLVDLGRFAYPVRPILYMAICYLAISIVYMIGVAGEERFACGPYGNGMSSLVTQGGENMLCSALAVAHYYFTMASCAWWVVLCLAWFLAANLKWGAESIAGQAPYFHLFCWGLPALLSVLVLVSNSIDGDVFSGICSVGNLQPKAMWTYVFIPMATSLGLGLFLLMCGVWSMTRIRSYIKLQHADVDRNISKLEKLMLRVSAFAFMYALPTAVSAGLVAYHAVQMPVWIQAWYTNRCWRDDRVMFGFVSDRSTCPPKEEVAPPELFIFLIKYLCQLLVGITCAVWVCSSKTLGSYQRAYARVCRQRDPVATNEQ